MIHLGLLETARIADDAQVREVTTLKEGGSEDRMPLDLTRKHQIADGEMRRVIHVRQHIEGTEEIVREIVPDRETAVSAHTDIAQDLHLRRNAERGREVDQSHQPRRQCRDLVQRCHHKTTPFVVKLPQERRHRLKSRSPTSNLQVSSRRKPTRSPELLLF